MVWTVLGCNFVGRARFGFCNGGARVRIENVGDLQKSIPLSPVELQSLGQNWTCHAWFERLPFFKMSLTSALLKPRTGICFSCGVLDAPRELLSRVSPCPPVLSRFALRCDA